jgi:zinc protease
MATRRTVSRLALTAVALAIGTTLVGAQAPQRPDRSKPPAVGPAPALRLGTPQKATLANGLRVWVLEQHAVPLVQLNVLVLSGASADPAGKFGAGSLAAAMLDEGAGGRAALELADQVEFLGAALATTAGFDSSAVRMSTPVARLAEALPLLADVTIRPDFPQAELERLRAERLTAFVQARDDPQSLAGLAFPRLVFGPTHRYGTSATGTEATTRGLTLDDLRGFHRAHYRPDNAVLIAVGDVTPATLLPLVEKSFGAWKGDGPKPAAAAVPQAPQVAKRQVFLVDKPGAPQSQVRVGWVGVPRSTPDYFPLQVLNTILGGSFTSRLNQNLRETHGYSYGAFSTFDMRLSAGPFYAMAGVQTDKTAEALKEFFVELNGMLKPIAAEEVEKAKNYVALGFPGEFETNSEVAARLEQLVVFGLPDDYFSQYVPRIQAVTPADVARVAKAYLQPDRFQVMVVGDRAAVAGPIEAAGFAPITVVPIDDVMK